MHFGVLYFMNYFFAVSRRRQIGEGSWNQQIYINTKILQILPQSASFSQRDPNFDKG